jgi:hypothetical protein
MAARWSREHPHRNHVAFDELAKMNPRVEPSGDKIERTVVGNVEDHIGGTRELRG